LHNEVELENGQKVTLPLFRQVFAEEMRRIESEVGMQRFTAGKFALAAKLFQEIIEKRDLDEFLTLGAYPYLD